MYGKAAAEMQMEIGKTKYSYQSNKEILSQKILQ